MAHSVAAPILLSPNNAHPTVTATSSPVLTHTPASDRSSNNTFLMSASPVRSRRSAVEGYKPKMISTIGAKPACLVNASVTYVGDDQIYAFGGFDQYTDEGVYRVGSSVGVHHKVTQTRTSYTLFAAGKVENDSAA